MSKFLKEAGIEDIGNFQLFTGDASEFADLLNDEYEHTTDELVVEVLKLNRTEKKKLTALAKWVNVQPTMNVDVLNNATYEDIISVTTPLKPASTPASTTSATSITDAASEFTKGIKKDPTQYDVFQF